MERLFRTWFQVACVVFGLILGSGCATKSVPVPPPVTAPEEIVVPPRAELVPEVVFDVPQLVSQAAPLSDAPLMSAVDQAVLHERALERFFAPWRMTRASLSSVKAFWGVAAYGGKQGYAENLQPYPRDRWDRLVALQNVVTYPSMASTAIIVRNTSVRVLPSLRPFFLDPAKPGEGFPFDYFQNTSMWMGTPVLVTHASSDQAWYFVETAFSYGWVRREDVALADANFCAEYKTRAMVALRMDDTSLVGQGRFFGQTHIGAIFPLHSELGGNVTVKVPVRGATAKAEIGLAELNSMQAALMPLPMTSRTVAALADAMSGQLYGWGGLFENRDCSSTLRDLFLPFGIWLPRNSSQQAQTGGRLVSLEGLGADAKLAVIRGQGVPFASFIWLQGHIGLYLGTDVRGEPLMLHNIWGVRTMLPDGGEGRAVVGRLVISTLRPGEERNDVRRGAFLEKVRGLTILDAGAVKARQ
jgi:hypothetical protein